MTCHQVADQFILHVWVPSHTIARACATIAREFTSRLPHCTVQLTLRNTVLAASCRTMQVWITMCDEPDIYSNASSRAQKCMARVGVKAACMIQDGKAEANSNEAGNQCDFTTARPVHCACISNYHENPVSKPRALKLASRCDGGHKMPLMSRASICPGKDTPCSSSTTGLDARAEHKSNNPAIY